MIEHHNVDAPAVCVELLGLRDHTDVLVVQRLGERPFEQRAELKLVRILMWRASGDVLHQRLTEQRRRDARHKQLEQLHHINALHMTGLVSRADAYTRELRTQSPPDRLITGSVGGVSMIVESSDSARCMRISGHVHVAVSLSTGMSMPTLYM